MFGNRIWPTLMAQRKTCWDELRDMGPVVLRPDGTYDLTRREDVIAALADTEVFSSAGRTFHAFYDTIGVGALPTGFDPPDHTRYRDLIRPVFSSTALKELEPTMARLAAVAVNDVAATGQCEAVSQTALPYTVAVLQVLLGLPMRDGGKVTAWKNTVLTAAPGSEAYLSAGHQLLDYLSEAFAERRRNPRLPGYLTAVAGLTDKEALAAAFTALGAGNANETVIIGFALAALAADPELRRLLRADPEQTNTFVREILRLEPPVSGLGRVTTRDVTVAGVTIPAGSKVSLRLGAINREDSSDDISACDGQLVRHKDWTFGAGPHRCPAASLARIEMTLLINEWLRRIPDFAIEPTFPAARYIDIVFDGGVYMLRSLPLQWEAQQLTAPDRYESPSELHGAWLQARAPRQSRKPTRMTR